MLADLPLLLQKTSCGSAIEMNFIALRPGDVIDIPEGVKHWHGAQRDSWFQHIATHVKTADASGNEWLEAVSDEDYGKLQ